MKKSRIYIFTLMIVSIIMATTAFTSYAGDIPESLLLSEDAQIFFGEVVAYHPNKEVPDIEVSPIKKIKGDVKEGSLQHYKYPYAMGGFKITVGKVYLFTYYDGTNNTDVFEVTTYDTRTLKLKHVEGDMWKRFEKYMNEGKYGEAKIEGMLPYRVDIIRGVVAGVCVIAGVIVVVRWKRKRKQNALQG